MSRGGRKRNGEMESEQECMAKKNRSGDAPHKQERPSVGSMEIFKFAQPLDLCLIISAILLCKYICFYKI